MRQKSENKAKVKVIRLKSDHPVKVILMAQCLIVTAAWSLTGLMQIVVGA